MRRLPGFDDKVISITRGATTREIQGHVRELYGLSVSPELVSKVQVVEQAVAGRAIRAKVELRAGLPLIHQIGVLVDRRGAQRSGLSRLVGIAHLES